MQAILRRIPTADDIDRNKAKLAGFAAGIVVPLVLGAFIQVIYTGQGIGEPPSVPPMVYPNL